MKMTMKILGLVMLLPACVTQNDPIYQIPKDAAPIVLTTAQ